jgi:AcrR family transcriptional regulator
MDTYTVRFNLRTVYVSMGAHDEEAGVRARFTLAEVRAQAIQIVDKDGLAGLSMRSLAAALGTGPMTLYNYVKDREELEGLVAEAVLADVRLPRPSNDWRSDVKAVATAIWRTVRQHPNAAPLVLTRRTVSAAGYLPAERLVEALRRAGLTDLDVLAAFRGVLSLVMGAAQVELAGPFAAADREQSNAAIAKRIGDLAGTEHPHLATLAETSQRSAMGADFDRALDMLLTGIEAATAGR